MHWISGSTCTYGYLGTASLNDFPNLTLPVDLMNPIPAVFGAAGSWCWHRRGLSWCSEAHGPVVLSIWATCSAVCALRNFSPCRLPRPAVSPGSLSEVPQDLLVLDFCPMALVAGFSCVLGAHTGWLLVSLLSALPSRIFPLLLICYRTSEACNTREFCVPDILYKVSLSNEYYFMTLYDTFIGDWSYSEKENRR